ncbi:unnamed protein product, partial [Ectocarpus fasciculatus]
MDYRQEYFGRISYSSPLLIAACLLVSMYVLYASDAPNNAIDFFHSCWCGLQALAVAINLQTQFKFYDWFSTCDMHESDKRGLSTRGYKIFGLIIPPTLDPATFRIVAVGYLLALLTAAVVPKSTHTTFLLWIILFLGVLYFSSLWAERSASYHRETLTIVVHLYVVMCPWYYAQYSDADIQICSRWAVTLIKIHVASIYFASAIQKIGCSIIQGSLWFAHSPHTLIWMGMWSKPYYRSVQQWLFARPYIVHLSGLGVLLLELFFFATIGLRRDVQLVCAMSFLCFHTGVFILQGVDYITFWCPIFLLWSIDSPEAINWLHTDGFNVELLLNHPAMYPCTLFCAMQIIFSLFLLEDLNINMPPFTCCPMFVTVTKLVERTPRYYVMWDMRSSIAIENMEWLYPFLDPSCGLGMVEEDLAKIPFPFISFGVNAHSDDVISLQKKYTNDSLLGGREGFFLYSNTNISSELLAELKDLVATLHPANNKRSYSHAKPASSLRIDVTYSNEFLQKLIAQNEKCYDMFI